MTKPLNDALHMRAGALANDVDDERALIAGNDARLARVEWQLAALTARIHSGHSLETEPPPPSAPPQTSSRDARAALQLEIPAELEAALSREVYALPPVSDPLDAWDVAAAVCAGLAGGLIDFFLVRIPKDLTYLGRVSQRGSPVTQWLREAQLPADNWMSGYVKTAFDRVAPSTYPGPKIPGLNPRMHRLHTLGHDPLLGLVFGVLDTVLSTMTGIDTNGRPFVRPIAPSPEFTSPVFAPLVWLGHLFSDVATPMGLPIPGWGLTQLLQLGRIGDNEHTIAEITRWMYREGYDLRHLVSMGLAPGIVELIVRVYCAFRHGAGDAPPQRLHRRGERERSYDVEALLADLSVARRDARRDRILLFAHSLAAGANALKLAAYGGNPLALNVAQWACWLRSAARVSGVWLSSRPRRELERCLNNRRAIDTRWDELLSPATAPPGGPRSALAWTTFPSRVDPKCFEGLATEPLPP